jgi:hypothetical protein
MKRLSSETHENLWGLSWTLRPFPFTHSYSMPSYAKITANQRLEATTQICGYSKFVSVDDRW